MVTAIRRPPKEREPTGEGPKLRNPSNIFASAGEKGRKTLNSTGRIREFFRRKNRASTQDQEQGQEQKKKIITKETFIGQSKPTGEYTVPRMIAKTGGIAALLYTAGTLLVSGIMFAVTWSQTGNATLGANAFLKTGIGAIEWIGSTLKTLILNPIVLPVLAISYLVLKPIGFFLRHNKKIKNLEETIAKLKQKKDESLLGVEDASSYTNEEIHNYHINNFTTVIPEYELQIDIAKKTLIPSFLQFASEKVMWASLFYQAATYLATAKTIAFGTFGPAILTLPTVITVSSFLVISIITKLINNKIAKNAEKQAKEQGRIPRGSGEVDAYSALKDLEKKGQLNPETAKALINQGLQTAYPPQKIDYIIDLAEKFMGDEPIERFQFFANMAQNLGHTKRYAEALNYVGKAFAEFNQISLDALEDKTQITSTEIALNFIRLNLYLTAAYSSKALKDEVGLIRAIQTGTEEGKELLEVLESLDAPDDKKAEVSARIQALIQLAQ